jgi:hypothetical protein
VILGIGIAIGIEALREKLDRDFDFDPDFPQTGACRAAKIWLI